jgi:hypothetical protein
VDCVYDLDNLDTEVVHEHVLIDNVASSDGARSPEPGSLRLFNEFFFIETLALYLS